MSGHSKWHRIRHKKALTDQKRSKLFGGLARDIKQAARDGNDPAKNAALREAIDRAKKQNLPQANIDRILATDPSKQSAVLYEGFMPGGAALIISVLTDNTNRTIAELRQLLKQHGGTLAGKNAVMWKFTAEREGTNLTYVVQPEHGTSLSTEDKATCDALLTALDEHDDVIAVFTDVV